MTLYRGAPLFNIIRRDYSLTLMRVQWRWLCKSDCCISNRLFICVRATGVRVDERDSVVPWADPWWYLQES